MTCHSLALIDKYLNSCFGFDATLGAEATKMNGMFPPLEEQSLWSQRSKWFCRVGVGQSALLSQAGAGGQKGHGGFPKLEVQPELSFENRLYNH